MNVTIPEGGTAVADVFISYHRSDSASALVARIVGELESAGISCWYDTKDPKLGYFTDAITHEIEQCKVFLLLWDEGANESRYCISETHYAFNYAKDALILPFQIGTFERNRKLSFYTGAYQIIIGGKSLETADTDELIKKIAAGLPDKIIQCGECGDNVTYTLNENGVLAIFGNGPMKDYILENVPWYDKRKKISCVRILNGVTSIGKLAFLNCEGLSNVSIPNSVTYIESSAFEGCVGLDSVDIPNSVTYIGFSAFEGCVGLDSVDIPDSVTYIGGRAFYGCANLKYASVPAETEIDSFAFPRKRVIRRPIK